MLPLTSGEVLRGFEKGSLGAIISVHGLSYSNPVLSVPRMKELLVDGGLIKVRLLSSDPGNVRIPGMNGFSVLDYLSELEKNGFSAIYDAGVLLAIKGDDSKILSKIWKADIDSMSSRFYF